MSASASAVSASAITAPPGTADLGLPFFAYGIFSPGQIAFFQIKNYVRQVTAASAAGNLRIRDGVLSATFAEVPDGKTASHSLGVLAHLLDPGLR
jgi:hypothetical protein